MHKNVKNRVRSSIIRVYLVVVTLIIGLVTLFGVVLAFAPIAQTPTCAPQYPRPRASISV